MEDSKLLIYIVLAAIYVIAKFLKSKKPAQPEQDEYETEAEKPTGPTFEELFEELTKQKNQGKKAEEEIVTKETTNERVEVPSKDVEPEPRWSASDTSRNLSTLQTSTEESADLDEDIEELRKTTAPTTVVRDKPKYERSQKYKIKEDQDSEVASDIMDLLSSAHGAKRAIVLKEIFDRKY